MDKGELFEPRERQLGLLRNDRVLPLSYVYLFYTYQLGRVVMFVGHC